MNTREIEAILERYFEGYASLAEEKILQDFFRSETVPAHLEQYRKLFLFIEEERTAHFTPELQFGRDGQLNQEDQPALTAVVATRSRFNIGYVMSMAAGVLLVVGLFITLLSDYQKNRRLMQREAQSEVAFIQATEALLLVSGNLNNGLQQVQRLDRIGKAMQGVELFNKFYQYQILITDPNDNLTQSN